MKLSFLIAAYYIPINGDFLCLKIGDVYTNEFNMLLNSSYYLLSYFDVSCFIKSVYNDYNFYGKNNRYIYCVFVNSWLDFIYQMNKNILTLEFIVKTDKNIKGTIVVVNKFVAKAEN